MWRSREKGRILARAIAYPYATPRRSFVQRRRPSAHELPPGDPDLAGAGRCSPTAPTLARGSARKLAARPTGAAGAAGRA